MSQTSNAPLTLAQKEVVQSTFALVVPIAEQLDNYLHRTVQHNDRGFKSIKSRLELF